MSIEIKTLLKSIKELGSEIKTGKRIEKESISTALSMYANNLEKEINSLIFGIIALKESQILNLKQMLIASGTNENLINIVLDDLKQKAIKILTGEPKSKILEEVLNECNKYKI